MYHLCLNIFFCLLLYVYSAWYVRYRDFILFTYILEIFAFLFLPLTLADATVS